MVYSLITLFPPTATVFDTNGLGSLGEAISCVVTEERNGSFELEMVYPVSGKHYPDMGVRSILVVKPNPVDKPQAFRIYKFTKPMDGQVTYYAAHISYDLDGYPVEPFSADSRTRAMAQIRGYMIGTNTFTFSADAGGNPDGYFKIDTPTSIRSILGGSEGSILETFGGEYKFDNFKVSLLNNRGMDRGVVIRYGKNLTDLKEEASMENVYTHVLPYWYGEVDEIPELVTLPETILPATTSSYDFQRIYTLDMTSSFQEKPFVVDLRQAANDWIAVNNPSLPYTSLDISFVQLEQTEEYKDLALLERVELCDDVTVQYPEFGISVIAKVMKTVYDVIAEKYTSVTLGNIRPSLSDTIIGQGDDLSNATGYLKDVFGRDLKNGLGDLSGSVDDRLGAFGEDVNKRFNEFDENFNKKLAGVKTDLEKATEEATNWITNGKGYMVAVKNEVDQWTEICSLDNPDIKQAIQVWRWNNGGFGHSSHGYNGPYDLAITQDGKINADFITTGNLTANLIRSGVLYLGGTGSNTASVILYSKDPDSGKQIENGYIGLDTYINTLSCDYINGFVRIYRDNPYAEDYAKMTCSLTCPIAINIMPEDGDTNYGISLANDRDGYLQFADMGDELILDGPFDGLLVETNGRGMYVDKFYACTEANSISMSKDYGARIISSTYSPSSIFEDLGEGETDEIGKCYVYLDEVFLAGIAAKVEYQVFLQKEGPGDVWVSEKTSQYFVVEGTENLKFSWIIKAKKKGTEYNRMNNYYVASIDAVDYEAAYMEEMADLNNNSIKTFETSQIRTLEEILQEKEEAIYEAIE